VPTDVDESSSFPQNAGEWLRLSAWSRVPLDRSHATQDLGGKAESRRHEAVCSMAGRRAHVGNFNDCDRLDIAKA
jgi:hypothetical protein